MLCFFNHFTKSWTKNPATVTSGIHLTWVNALWIVLLVTSNSQISIAVQKDKIVLYTCPVTCSNILLFCGETNLFYSLLNLCITTKDLSIVLHTQPYSDEQRRESARSQRSCQCHQWFYRQQDGNWWCWQGYHISQNWSSYYVTLQVHLSLCHTDSNLEECTQYKSLPWGHWS